MRPTESKAYHGNANGEREISGPEMIAGAWKARHVPVYSMAAMPSKITASPRVKAGLSGRAGLKRNCRMVTSELKDRPLLRNDGEPRQARRQVLSGTTGVT